ncbi:MAG: hypothetical protein GWO39_04140, partial [Gammaproteobacteria bacterium]|nr:hypothetical protein [Gammaproteobacteria bacterium]NIT63002.1 hypothetical protein [Gammaproteobacteria bacterium]NIV19956.1 hypothetical protein [Gammaproteobacteria bacterium]NIY31582.1 hypothetical protein [Gammaproteobacteria bacterium]
MAPDILWDRYLEYARAIGNEQQLLIGDDAAWFEAARGMFEKHPIRARALYALLALRARASEDRLVAHQQLALLIRQQDGGVEILRQL